MAQFENLINPTTSYDVIEGNGIPVISRLTLNFVSPDVTVTDDAANSRTNVTFPAFVHIAGSTMTGNLILNGDPTLPLQAATKEYVDSLAAGLSPRTSCRVATTGALNATYNNGSSGVGATLTNAGSQAAIVIDGVTLSLNDRVLVKDQASQLQNGIYTATTLGDGSHNWVLTRSTDFNTAGAGGVVEGAYTVISAGTMWTGALFVETGQGPFTIGTTPIIFSLFNPAVNLSATAPITLTGSVIGMITPLDPTYGGTGVDNVNSITLGGDITTGGAFTTSGSHNLTLTTTGNTNVTLPTSGTLVNTSVTTLSSLSSIGTITSGIWNSTLISSVYGGTGVNNGTSTITLGGALTFSGAYTTTLTVTGNTSLTLPTSGTIMVGANNLSEITNATTARSNLGLGTAATHAVMDFLLVANNLSDVASASSARTNLGLAIGTNVEAWSATLDTVTAGTYVGSTSITTLGTISTGTWNGSIITGTYGGTGVNNGSKTITLGGNFTTSGANNLTFTTTGTTNVTLPTSGTLMAGSNNLSELTNLPTARSNLGVDVCLYQVKMQKFTTSGTYTPTSGMVYCWSRIVGGGGGGGGAAAATTGDFAAGAGGGAAGYSEKLLSASDIGASQTITIGAGGAGGIAGNNNGSPGGDTTLGAILTGHGGAGGEGGGSQPAPDSTGGVGGTATGGDLNLTGEAGGCSYGGFGSTNAFSGKGGNSILGTGGQQITPPAAGQTAGSPGNNYGAGGSGGASYEGGTSEKGGDGSQGVGYIIEYIKRG